MRHIRLTSRAGTPRHALCIASLCEKTGGYIPLPSDPRCGVDRTCWPIGIPLPFCRK